MNAFIEVLAVGDIFGIKRKADLMSFRNNAVVKDTEMICFYRPLHVLTANIISFLLDNPL